MSIFLRKSVASLLSATRLVRLPFGKGAERVLMYHRVIPPESLSYPIQAGMYVRPETFRLHCEILKEEFNVVPLSALSGATPTDGPTQDAEKRCNIAITFDDGWVDNYTFAFPILQEFKLPATIFLPTAYIGGTKLFWTDLVGVYLSKRREGFVLQTIESLIEKVGSELEELLNYIFSLPRETREELAAQLSFVLKESFLPERQFFNWDEARTMEESGLITFANHSHSHPLLGELTPEGVAAEVERAASLLSRELRAPLSHVVAYPGGSRATLPEGFTGVGNTPETAPGALGRIGVHEDISNSKELFLFRLSFQR